MTLRELLSLARTSVVTSSQGDLCLGWRLRIWKFLEKTYPQDWRFRKSALAYLAARDLLGDWRKIEHMILAHELMEGWIDGPVKAELPHLPYLLLEKCAALLDGASSRDATNSFLEGGWAGVEALASLSDSLGMAVMVPHAALAACECALGVDDETCTAEGWYELIQSEEGCSSLTDDLIESPQGWDVYCIASEIAANGFLWDDRASPEKRRAYFLHLIDARFAALDASRDEWLLLLR